MTGNPAAYVREERFFTAIADGRFWAKRGGPKNGRTAVRPYGGTLDRHRLGYFQDNDEEMNSGDSGRGRPGFAAKR